MTKSIFILSWAHLKRRKKQNLLVGLCIALSALLFSSTVSLLKGMEKPFDLMYDQLNASHLLLIYDHREMNTSDARIWFLSQPEVTAVAAALPYIPLQSPVIFHEKELDLSIQLTERIPNQSGQDQVFFSQGEATTFPKMGEIWIPEHLAKSHQINLGDTLGIPTDEGLYPLVVSATLTDPQFASGLFNPTRAWVAPGSLSFIFPPHRLHDFMLGIRFKKTSDIDNVLGRFHHEMNFTGHSLQYALFKSVFLSFYQIISLILLLFSILSIVIALFILYTALNGSIATDLKLIGLYKGMGFTPFNIVQVYVIQYFILTFVSLPIGLLGSYFITQILLGILFDSVGLANSIHLFPQVLVGTALGFSIFISLLIWQGSRKAANINTVAAIRADSSTATRPLRLPMNIWTSQHISVPIIWGLSMLLSNPKRSIYTGISITIAIFMVLFSINISHSFSNLQREKAAWGFEDSDLQIKRNDQIALPLEYNSIFALLQEEDRIHAITPYDYTHAILPSIQGQIPQNLSGKFYAGDFKKIGLFNLEGQHPKNSNEISLCVLTAQELEKQIGDSIFLFIEGTQKQFLITGIYQDVSNLGKGFRLSEQAINILNPLSEPSFYALKLEEGTDIQAFQDYLQTKFGETIIIEQSVEKRKGIQSTIESMQASLGLISLFFLTILFIILFNDTLMNIRDYRRSLGILKSVGMTSGQLKWAQVYKFLALGTCCLLIGIPLGVIFSPILISQLTQNLGLIDFPFQLNTLGSFLVIPGMLLFVSLSAWWASGRMIHTQARKLIFYHE